MRNFGYTDAMISVVIPTLNAARTLPAALAALAPGLDSGLIKEVLISDGGSTDGTPDLARTLESEVVTGPRGRGGQLQRGAIAARGEWLLFLHCDTILDPEWLFAAEEFVADRDNVRRAAAFRFALDDDHPRARRLERMVAWRCDKLGLPYGDQGLLLSRLLYRQVGGFRDLPLMEDVDLVRRIGRKRMIILPIAARTAATRYQQGGYWRRPARNLLCLALYYLGIPPKQIARVYR